MTVRMDDLTDQLPDDDEGAGTVLPGFAVTARFRRVAETGEDAERLVRAELRSSGQPYDDAKVEPREPDGRWAVDVRFVVVSIDGETAVDGVHQTLREAGITPDDVWLSERLT